MTNFIAVFPLASVVYPDEKLNLHIFEPRYIQLINECIEQKKNFGIPVVLNGKVAEYGTMMEITEVVKKYDDGKMDIRIKGVQVFRILELVKAVPDKLYSGAIVNYPENQIIRIHPDLSDLIVSEVKKLYQLFDLSEKLNVEEAEWSAYDIAHKVGLALEDEYELLKIFNETQRLEFLRRHLKNLQPVIDELEKLKERIKLNGHFRNISSPDFN